MHYMLKKSQKCCADTLPSPTCDNIPPHIEFISPAFEKNAGVYFFCRLASI